MYSFIIRTGIKEHPLLMSFYVAQSSALCAHYGRSHSFL